MSIYFNQPKKKNCQRHERKAHALHTQIGRKWYFVAAVVVIFGRIDINKQKQRQPQPVAYNR